MTKYEYFKTSKTHCENMAKEYQNDEALFKFYMKAAAGFQLKLEALTIAEAEEPNAPENPLLKNISEAEVVEQVKQVIQATGLKLQRINTGCFKVGKRFIKTADAGTLDFEGYDNRGRFLAIECKRPVGGRLSPEQKARIADINEKGGVAFVVHSGAEALGQLNLHDCL